MGWGVKLYDKNGNEMVDRFVPVFIADYITEPSSGSRSYPAVQGKTLKALPLSYMGHGGYYGTPPGEASVSGNSISWNNISQNVPLLVVYE
ncbi:hypothetical protein [Klebsiella grimontii]|uniref:hypothetical protein n=1 Tax=Klebsiella grimontii TaxID=2058152 RepID=UPI0012B76D49|nr:hypothetical protein [Klebsiella grimontii]